MKTLENIITRVQDSFDKQALMTTMGARMAEVAQGRVVIELPFNPALTQQHGFLHGGTVAAVLDSACGYAGLSVMDDDSAVLTVEFKVNYLRPAIGDLFRFEGQVVNAGKTLVLTEGRAYGISPNGEKLIATMSATMMCVRGKGISA